MTRFAILGLDHVVLRVQDLQRMTRFYCDVLGCSIERVEERLGLMQLRAGESLIDLVALDGELGRRGGAGPRKVPYRSGGEHGGAQGAAGYSKGVIREW